MDKTRINKFLTNLGIILLFSIPMLAFVIIIIVACIGRISLTNTFKKSDMEINNSISSNNVSSISVNKIIVHLIIDNQSEDVIIKEEIEEIEEINDILVITTNEDELHDLTMVVYNEAGNQDYEGKRLVAACVLNRVDDSRFPNTILDVIHQPNQFTDWEAHIYVDDIWKECEKAVLDEIEERSNTDVLWFKLGGYHTYGTPLFKHGDHYFNGK